MRIMMSDFINANTIITHPVLAFDPAKEAANVAKHGISLADALLVYATPDKLTLQSDRGGENRLMDIAPVDRVGVVLVLVYTMRGNVVRAISLRRASREERRMYEQAC